MPRKSKALRLAQTIDLIEKYEAAGLGTDRVCNFAKDMRWRLERGKAPSAGRRRFLDDVIEQGVPEPKGDPVLIDRIDEAIATEGAEGVGFLRQFRGIVARGWGLSEKQARFCEKLIDSAKAIREDTFWRPDEETTERIKLAVSCYICYGANYWTTHPGGARAMDAARNWLAGDTVRISEYHVEKLFKSVAGKLRDLENPRFSEGDFAFHSSHRLPGVILSGPKPTRTGIAYDVLVGGQIITSTNLYKRG